MQLSIEAIIILVIAMVLLGLGIAFISGFFKEGTTKLQEPFDAIKFGCNPDANDPIKTSPTILSVKPGEQLQVKICAYAPVDAPQTTLSFAACTCTLDDKTQCGKPGLLTQGQSIKRTDVGGFNTILIAKDSTSNKPLLPATYICTLEAKSASAAATTTVGSTQVTITVT
jgi:hypothetical protein